MSTRNRIAITLTIVSLALLIPGLLQPMMTITASISLLGNTREIFRQTQSIIEAVRSLWNSGNAFVAGLILLFSVTIPFLKAIAFFVILTMKDVARRRRLYLTVRSLSKWSMADVFVVGVFIAYLAAVATDNLNAVIDSGFYYFVGYCLVSNLAFQLLELDGAEATR
ncbi:MAG: paraquat-inducible protein A [Gemmatimonadetes bacterium]|nr:paraquat-inducible protein A [Gemmatimonadota bacterium]